MDYLFKGMARDKKVRIVCVDASESVAKICRQHNTLPLTTMTFSRFLLAGAIMGCLEKDTQGITLQINSDGPIKSLFMQATCNGLIRGYVGKNDGDLDLKEELSVEKVVGDNGIFSVTKTIDAEHHFTSDVILTSSNISSFTQRACLSEVSFIRIG